MQKHRVYIMLTSVAILSFFLSIGRNVGQEMQSPMIQSADDITAWQEDVFVLDNKTLIKLNAQLEVVKSVPLPLEPGPLKPGPVGSMIVPPDMEGAAVSPRAGAMDARLSGRVCADAQYIYVLYEGVIFAFDHDLQFVKSKTLEYST